MRNTYTAEQREKLVDEVRTTGARVVDVARRMGIEPAAAYVWLKRSRAAATSPGSPVFARVVPSRSPTVSGLMLELGAIKLHIGTDFDPALLRQVLTTLGALT